MTSSAYTPFSEFLGDIALRVLESDANDMEATFEAILGDIGERFGVDRVVLRWIEQIEGKIGGFVAWLRKPEVAGRVLPLDEVPWLSGQARAGVVTCISGRKELPPEAETDRQSLATEGLEAVFLMPLMIEDEIYGALTLASQRAHEWTDHVEAELRVLGALIARAHWGVSNRAMRVESEYVAAEQIRSSEAMLSFLMESINDAVFAIDDNYTIVDCNPTALRLLGVTREAVIGETPWKFSPLRQPDGVLSKDKAKSLIDDAFAGHVGPFEWVHRAADGTELIMVISLTAIETRDGIRVFGILYDTTELKQANQELARNAEFQRHKADLLISLTSLQKEDADRTIDLCLASIGEIYDAQRIHLWWYADNKDTFSWSHRWLADGAVPSPVGDAAGGNRIRWVADQLRAGTTVTVNDVKELNADAAAFRELAEQTKCDTFLAVPMIVDDRFLGACTFAAEEPHAWDQLAIDELEVLSNILATSISRFRSTEALGAKF